MKDLQKIYTDKVNEALFRLQKCESLIESYFEIKDLLDLESSILHLRKAVNGILKLTPFTLQMAK